MNQRNQDDTDEFEDERDVYTPNKPRCNEDFVRDLMNYSPRGALCQAFIMHAIQRYAQQVAVADPKDYDSGFVNGQAWVDVAKDVEAKCKAFYGRHG